MILSPSVALPYLFSGSGAALRRVLSLMLVVLLFTVSGCTKCGGGDAPQAVIGEPADASTFEELFSTMPDDGEALELNAAQKSRFKGHWLINPDATLEGLSGEMLDHMRDILSYSKIGFVFDGDGKLTVHDAAERAPGAVDGTYEIAHIRGDAFVLAVNADDIRELGMDYLLVHFFESDTLRFAPIVGPSFFGDEPVFVLNRTTKEALDAAMSVGNGN